MTPSTPKATTGRCAVVERQEFAETREGPAESAADQSRPCLRFDIVLFIEQHQPRYMFFCIAFNTILPAQVAMLQRISTVVQWRQTGLS